MRIHAVVDYSYLYYKYYFMIKYGHMGILTAPVNLKGLNVEKDITIIYHSIKEIEGFRRQLEGLGHDVTMSICFDMPSLRTEEATEGTVESEYKANRTKTLDETDFADMNIVEELLDKAGHNTFKIEGYEADDLAHHIVNTRKDEFDYTIIYTPDSDLLVNIGQKVGATRYKSKYGYSNVDMSNFSEYLADEFKVREFPYNAVMLYKSTVGDKSDNIKGIQRFGVKAFDKLVVYLNEKGIEWEKCATYEGTIEALELTRGYLKEDQLEQAFNCLELVKPVTLGEVLLELKEEKSTMAKREGAYLFYGMKSLVE